MDGPPESEFNLHRPGAISTFFIYKAALFAVCFWGWLATLAIRGDGVTGWTVVAGAGAIATTLAAVVLWIRYGLLSVGADRHAAVMRTLVDLSWQSFAQSARGPDREPRDVGLDGPRQTSDADVISLSTEARNRPRR